MLYTAIVKNEAFLAMALMPLGNYLANLARGKIRPTRNIRTFCKVPASGVSNKASARCQTVHQLA
jgi:hypothetical protein